MFKSTFLTKIIYPLIMPLSSLVDKKLNTLEKEIVTGWNGTTLLDMTVIEHCKFLQ